MNEKIRSFICVEISEEARAEIARIQSELRRKLGDISWVRPESIHLTLKFLGDIEPGQVEPITAAIRDVASATDLFTLQVAAGGAFPNAKKPNVLWVGIGGDLDLLRELASLLEKKLEIQGFSHEARPFRPHLTIGRVRRPQGGADVARLLTEVTFTAPPFQISDILLMRSELGPAEARHTPLARAALKR